MRLAICLLLAAMAQAETGQELFTRHCAICHAAAGEGSSGPDLTSPSWQSGVSDADLARIIGQGAPGTAMPAFSGRLSAADITAVVAHLRTLAGQAIQPSNTLRA
ncbi:MAG TPA: cytochrome c, partial [Bryobacteraceae bacterium]|nr:cytochrome c [Bryobacteraceae bacterium]